MHSGAGMPPAPCGDEADCIQVRSPSDEAKVSLVARDGPLRVVPTSLAAEAWLVRRSRSEDPVRQVPRRSAPARESRDHIAHARFLRVAAAFAPPERMPKIEVEVRIAVDCVGPWVSVLGRSG